MRIVNHNIKMIKIEWKEYRTTAAAVSFGSINQRENKI